MFATRTAILANFLLTHTTQRLILPIGISVGLWPFPFLHQPKVKWQMRAIQLMNALSNLSPSLSLPKLHPMALPQENKKEHLSLSLSSNGHPDPAFTNRVD